MVGNLYPMVPPCPLIHLLLLWPADAYNFAFYSLLGYLTSDATRGGARNTSRIRRDTHLGTAAQAVRVAEHAATHTTYDIRARRPERRIRAQRPAEGQPIATS